MNPQNSELLLVNGTFFYERNEFGARTLQFVFNDGQDDISINCAKSENAWTLDVVRKSLKTTPKVSADCWIGTPNQVRTNYQLYGVTEDSLRMDFDMDTAAIAAGQNAIVDLREATMRNQQSRVDYRTVQRQRQASLTPTARKQPVVAGGSQPIEQEQPVKQDEQE